MAELTYRDAVARGIAQEMARDDRVVLIGEDVAGAGGVFKTTVGLLDQFGPKRVVDTPIAEQAIIGAAMGAAMTGLRPIAEIMFSDFFAVCWDIVANEIAKTRYMTNGQVTLPLVIKTGNGGGLRFGAQHSQSVENWAMAVPGLKVVTPSTPRDVVGLMAAAVRSDDPVLFFEHKGLYRKVKEDLPEEEYTVPIGKAKVVREGKDLTIITYGAMVWVALEAADKLAAEGVSVEVVDLRTLLPLDRETVCESVRKTSKVLLLHEDTRTGGMAGELAVTITENVFEYLDGPIVRVTAPDTPVPYSPPLEEAFLPNAEKVVEKARWLYRY
jgi:pyruvate/2-oxoglutarate/acetoin dehydrogenase E1 component